jgi:hypothetical protein
VEEDWFQEKGASAESVAASKTSAQRMTTTAIMAVVGGFKTTNEHE